ncbi:OB-fold putative lipoprotein [Seonamhaeicola sp. ML3]|uniref:OB-fold putative lipoprotein n=1 Tax=Seonamhaeicola sp. ML3 TaxID=2937786 RepID=UPI00201072E4|nr:OB-fold putative lipoprotein [Seonamhaeicola sp. ML3]
MRKYVILLLIVLFALIGYNYLYQDHRDITAETPEFVLTAETLSNEFSNAPIEAEKQYLNKTIEISGTITEVEIDYLVMNENIFCRFKQGEKLSPSKGLKSKIKGRLIGYDDLLEEVKLDQCTILTIKP